MPRLVDPPKVEVKSSAALSLTARPGTQGVRGRHVAILVAPGVNGGSVESARGTLVKAGVVVHVLAARLGAVAVASGKPIEPDGTFETNPSVLFDGVVVPDGEPGADDLGSLGQVLEFLKDQYRHAKPMLALGAGSTVFEEAGIPMDDADDWALVTGLGEFAAALAKHRNWDRQIDPPPI
jgi:catalase